MEDVELRQHEISKSLTRKILFMGVEKYYLKFMMIPFLFVGVIVGPRMNFSIFGIMVVNFFIFLIMGQFLARKNPFWVEQAIRHLSYKKFYLPHGQYSKAQDNILFKGNKGFRTFEDVSRNN